MDGWYKIKRNASGASRNFKMGYDSDFNFTLGDFGPLNNNTNAWLKHLTISHTTGNVGIGTTPSTSALLTLNDTTQVKARLILSGQEFYQPGQTSTDGIALTTRNVEHFFNFFDDNST